MWIAFAVVSAWFFAAAYLLGRYAAVQPLHPIDLIARGLAARYARAAIALSDTGRGPFLTGASLAAFIVYAIGGYPLWIPLLLVVSQVCTQTIANAFKRHFARVRPEYWHHLQERGHSYPSGHATTAALFFFGWGLVAAIGTLPEELKIAALAVLTLWALGISWSRLALGAHYLTDVLGGILLGLAWICAVLAVLTGGAPALLR